MGGVLEVCWDLGWIDLGPPQFASHRGSSCDGFTGNLRNADIGIFCSLENDMPRFLVPFKYLITYLTALMCPRVG